MKYYVRPGDEVVGDPSLPLPEVLKRQAALVATQHSDLDYAEALHRAEAVFGRHLADPPTTEVMNRMIGEIIEGP